MYPRTTDDKTSRDLPSRSDENTSDDIWSWVLLAALATVIAGCDDGTIAPEQVDPRPTMPAIVRLVPRQLTFGVGESVVTHLFIENATNVGSVPFHLKYDPEVLQYVGSEEGTFMNSDGTNTVFLVSDTGGGGELVVGLARLGGVSGASGSGVLATFEFLAVGSGDGGLAFTGAGVKDPMAQYLPASFLIVPVSVVP